MARIVSFTVALSQASLVPVTVDYTTQNISATGGLVVVPPADYIITSGTLTFAPGETTKVITVPVREDTPLAPAESFTMVLSNPVNGVIVGSASAGTAIFAGTTGPVIGWELTVSFDGMSALPTEPTLLALSAAGNQFVDSAGARVHLKGLNWYGQDGTSMIMNGLYNNISFKEILDQVRALGFNCLRLPFSDDMVYSTATFNATTGPQFVGNANAELLGKTPLQALTVIAEYCAEIGLRILLDHHRISKDAVNDGVSPHGTDGWPTMSLSTDTWLFHGSSTPAVYGETEWQAMWTALATHCTTGLFATDPRMANVIVGFEPHNEPHNVTWDVWAGMCERLFPVVHAIAPDWMMFVDGVANDGVNLGVDDQFWWGGYFKDVATRPISVTPGQDKVCYTPHEYGHSVSEQPWMSSTAQTSGGQYPVLTTKTVADYPDNIEERRDEYWGFIYRDNIAPLFVGEFGGGFGLDANTGAIDPLQTSSVYEVQWMEGLVRYLNGLRTDDTSMVSEGGVGISFAYFALNPESGNPLGGLVINADYATIQVAKMTLILPLLEA